ncbi:MAG: Bax inhibitor-1/YccA family protein [Faecalibacterium sp.]
MFFNNNKTDDGYRPNSNNSNSYRTSADGTRYYNDAGQGDSAFAAASAHSAANGMTVSEYFTKTFRWMAFGLLLTFGFAVATAYTGLWQIVYSLYLPLTLVELGLVLALSARVQKMRVATARTLFLVYAALNGMVMSFYFVIYELSTLILAFLAAGIYFGLLAVYGAVTKRDLSTWGPKLMMGLVALIVVSFIGMFTGMSYLASVLYSGIGLVIFMLLTAYDTQKIYRYYEHYADEGAMLEKSAIFGALSLYLDFINIFLFILRLFGKRSRS